MTTTRPYTRYIYWLDKDVLKAVKPELKSFGYQLKGAKMTPCETLNARGKVVFYAGPQLWSRLCTRQGSWYRQSDKAGKTLLVSDHPLPEVMQTYLDAQLSESDFTPNYFPTKQALKEMVASTEYQQARPDEWEAAGLKDGIMFKLFFSATRFWGRGDNLPRHWLNHRANHANFLSKDFTADMDGEAVPYTVSENKAVCSSCVEFFNVIAADSRKLVGACPGAITFSTVKRDTYYDVKPIGVPVIAA
jgi:hypothetical protein